MKTHSPSKYGVHFVGIGGIGTSALARWFLSQGFKVSGSDLSASIITQRLKKEGIKVFVGHKPSNLPSGTRLVVRSAASPLTNPEVKKAVKLGIRVKTYAQSLGDLTKKYRTIAVSGAHGKSTSTSLLSLALIKAGFDPTVIVGTNLKEFNGKNFRKGRGPHLIMEADEYQESFLNYSPAAAMITNIDREHLDFYKNLNAIKKVFLKFIGNIRRGGILVVNKDNENLSSLKKEIEAIAKMNELKVHWYGFSVPALSSAKKKIKKILKIPGEHNVSNALGVYVLAKALGAKEKDILRALGAYHGAWRRMEYRGNLELRIKNNELRIKKKKNGIIHNSLFKIPVYDDYAHHPTEIKATLSGVAKKYPRSHLICVFQPHQAKRLQALFKEFTTAFDDANTLVLLDIYKVAGRDKVSHNVNSLVLEKAIERRLKRLKNVKKRASEGPIRLKRVIHIPYSKQGQLRKIIEETIRDSRFTLHDSCVVVMMGAGDIVNYTNLLLSSGSRKKS